MDLVATGLAFADGLRWHDGALWLADMAGAEVVRVGPDGATVVHRLDGSPSGLGWLPDGRLLVVSMERRQVLRATPDGGLELHADLGEVATFHANDMVVDGRGNAYVGNMGSAHVPGVRRAPARLALVRPDGTVTAVGGGLGFPNGSAITPDGRRLLVAETMGRRIVAWTIRDDGTLDGERTWADLGTGLPDGIALDAEGGLWYADPRASACVRVLEGGRETHRVTTPDPCYSCALGGPDRAVLHVATAPADDPGEARRRRGGAVAATPAPSPGAGWP